MKPVSLVFCGINSFSERAEIDFSRLLDTGLFGIFGDTGSGKSTILDCIAFAVYGEIGRARSASIADVINYKCDKAYVYFEFETVYEGERRRYRVERELKRKNAVQAVKVYERRGDALAALAEGVRESNALLKRIVGLEQRDFEKCIALPQGEFAEFVRAQRGDRLKLMARLFDLEGYGEQLVKKVNKEYDELVHKAELLETELHPFVYATEAYVKQLSEQANALRVRSQEAQKAAAAAREEENRLKKLFSLRQDRERAQRRFAELQEKAEEMDALARDLSSLERADAAVQAQKKAEKAASDKSEAEASFQAAEADEKLVAAAADARKKEYDREAAEAEIARLTALAAQASPAEKLRGKIEEKQGDLAKARQDYAAEAKKGSLFPDSSYEEEREKLLARREALSGDPASILREEDKAGLFVREYGQFAAELTGLTERHPGIRPDSAPLIEKYQKLAASSPAAWETLRREFDAREKAYREVSDALTLLEQKKTQENRHLDTLHRLQTSGNQLKADIDALTAQLPQDALTEKEAKDLLEKCRAEKRDREKGLEEAEKRRFEAERTLAAARERREQAAKAEAEAAAWRDECLFRGGFSSAARAQELLARYGDAEQAKARLEAYKEERAALQSKLSELAEADVSEATEDSLAAAGDRAEAAAEEERAASRTLAVCEKDLEKAEADHLVKCEKEKAVSACKHRKDVFERLKKLLFGNQFMEFVAEEYLQGVAAGASGRLLSLTDGRYFLRYDGGFFVGDNFNGGELRGVHTLSGGETFLVSLSLALSLSEEICARSLRPTEFFFLDEGFGTLDGRLVDTVMDSLEKLKHEHFSIGIISHVEELKHRIERKLFVRKANEEHGSQILAE